jgi:GDP-L-fucose synthase
MIEKSDKIFIAGHSGFIGNAIFKRFKLLKYKNIVVANKSNLDLTNQKQVFSFLKNNNPRFIINAAGMTGGIYLNSNFPAEILYNNLTIQNNIIEGARINNIKNIIMLGSNACYPEFSKQPLKEKYLLTGSFNKTHEAFSIAKISGIKLCQFYNSQYRTNYKTLILPNIYGPGDSYDLNKSSFFIALLRKIYDAKIYNNKFIDLWGDGKSKRELMYVDDVADACLFFFKKKIKHDFINIGTGIEYSINQYAFFIMKQLGAKLKIKYEKYKYSGISRKILDVTVANNYGWKFKVNLSKGIKNTCSEFIKSYQPK